MVDLNDVVVVGMGRTPMGRFGGTLRDMEVIELGASVIPEVLKRAGVNSEQIDLVIWGHNRTSGYEGDTGRLVAVVAGIPVGCPRVHYKHGLYFGDEGGNIRDRSDKVRRS